MKRITKLDGVRGVAILLVLVYHYFLCELVSQKGLASRVSHAFSLSWSGVDLFFVLSGFLIVGILLDHRASSNYFWVFYARRICRIFPVYFLILGSFACLSLTSLSRSPSFEWLLHGALPLWSYVSFTQNLFMGARGDFGAGWLGVTWSLAVEEQFYLVIPVLIYFLPRRASVCVLLLGILAAPLLRYEAPGFRAFVDTPWRSDSILSGALLAFLVRWPPFIVWVRKNPNVLWSAFAGLLLGAAVLTKRPALLGVLNQSWLAGLYATFVLIAYLDNGSVIGKVLEWPVLVWFGRLSYGIYMYHQVANGLLHALIRHRVPQIRVLADAGITLLALCITLVMAALSYRFFEAPFLRLGHQVRYGTEPQSPLPVRSE